MSHEIAIAAAIYIALYLVKARYVVSAAMYYCIRLQYYGNKIPMTTGSNRLDVYVFIVASLVVGLILLIPMAFIERINFLQPYDRQILDNVARTTGER